MVQSGQDSGFLKALKHFTEKNRLKVISSVYMGSTEKEAVDTIASLKNTEVRISYDCETNPLHAKSYIFLRNNKENTVFIGSSNITYSAFHKNAEWNVKLTSDVNKTIVNQAINKFYEIWDDLENDQYDPNDAECIDKLDKALKKTKVIVETLDFEDELQSRSFEQRDYQMEALNKLFEERQNGYCRNLIVAATGTGKTAIAAFDYKRFQADNPFHSRLLFVAHRREILEKAQETFRSILNNSQFGELCWSRDDIDGCDHVFMSIQKLNHKINLLKELGPEYFDYIIIDETHHIPAKSYLKLLMFFKPKILLGLTATPERMDGRDIKVHYDNRVAFNLDLVTAIERGILSPFTYYVYGDNVNWSGINPNKAKDSEINKLLMVTKRSDLIISAVEELGPENFNEIRCLAFCANIDHAKFMCSEFEKNGRVSVG